MRDPYELLGVTREASREEVKRAYRLAAKKVHPDVAGGSHEAMIELTTACAFIISECEKRDKARAEQASGTEQGAQDYGRSSRGQSGSWRSSESRASSSGWEDFSKEINEELEALRRASADYEAKMRAKQRAAWQAGDRVTWAKLTWDDFFGFFTRTATSGLKGIGLLAAALLGIGSWLLEVNLVSAFILGGSLIGFALSVALKSDKGGLMSAVLVLLGLLTIWVPPTRSLLFSHPMATISILVCLALILKFAGEAGRAGLMTGGVVALYLIATIISQVNQPGGNRIGNMATSAAVPVAPKQSTAQQAAATEETKQTQPQSPQQTQAAVIAPASKPPAPTPVEPRELTAALGVKLVFNPNIPYQLKIRSGKTTTLQANEGMIALYRGGQRVGECEASITFTSPSSQLPYSSIDQMIHSCGSRAIFEVTSVQ